MINESDNKIRNKAVLVSFFNSDNLGDVLIGEMLCEITDKIFDVKKISYTRSPFVGDHKIDTSVENRLIKFKKVIAEYLSEIPIGKQIFYSTRKNKTLKLDVFESIVKESEVLIIGGGNMIFDLNKYSFSAKRFKTFVSIAKKYNKKVFAISLGIGPFQTIEQEKKAIEALELCDYITFRDAASYEIFRKHNQIYKNIYVSIDPVFLLSKKTQDISSDKVIALNIINNKLMKESEKKYRELINQYANLANGLVETLGKKVVLFSTEKADYEAVYDVFAIIKDNNNIEVLRITNAKELFDLYSNTLVLIGTRMHSMIVAHSQQIPVIGLSWQKKVDSMFEIIESKDSLFKYDEIDEKIDQILECTKAKVDNLEVEKSKIKDNLEKISKKNEINNIILNNLVKELEDNK